MICTEKASATFLRVDQHWGASRPGEPGGRVVLSELPRGDSPVLSTARCLNLVLDGVERYEIDGHVHHVEAGQFMLLDAGITSRAVLPERGITRGLCVYLPSEADPAVVPTEIESNPADFMLRSCHLTSATVPFARFLMGLGRRLTASPTMTSSEAEAVVFGAIAAFELVANDVAGRWSRLPAQSPTTRWDILQRLERARSFMHDHPMKTLGLAQIARVAGMSQFHFARSFRAAMGEAPVAYHHRLRMMEARTALRRGVPIRIVAERSGYADPSSFARAFRKSTGVSPGQSLP